ncbi:DUF1697 domain-containing protein [Salinibacterium sp. GXW1014]|uniref:DUF1697 domain-containing protein n=1 Tax=Salinibacterium sp. GXW1014 TaxID=3377838 RepID=UPI00383B7E19
MERRAWLVRAVNVGGTAKLPMAQWRALAEELGATDVATYIASGNLLCTPPGDPADFARALEREVEERFGFFREVVSRTRAELEAALREFPFGEHDPKFAYVTFLAGAPSADAVAAAHEVTTGQDTWELRGEHLYIRYAGGAGTADPGMARVGRILGAPGTARNLLTVRKLVDLLCAPAHS